jgi:hypothetical protein
MEQRSKLSRMLEVSYLFSQCGMLDIPTMEVEPERPPWAPKDWGKRRGGGGSKDSKRRSPKFRETKHGCMKRMR